MIDITGTVRGSTDSIIKVSVVDRFNTSVLAATSMTYDTLIGNSWYYDVPAADWVQGNGPWATTVQVYDESATVLDQTFTIECFDAPLLFTRIRAASANEIDINNIADGTGALVTSGNSSATLTVKEYGGTTTLSSASMFLINNGEYQYNTAGAPFVTGNDPWYVTFVLKDMGGSTTHLTLRMIGSNRNTP